MSELLSPRAFEDELRAIGAARYHNKHPFHKLLHGGELSKGQVQAWALNRYCYQAAVPRKDAALIARCHDQEVRRQWAHRITDHDGLPASGGAPEHDGGITRWLALTGGLGLAHADVISTRLALPATLFAVDAYVRFVAERSLLEAIGSSLTELFSPQLHRERIAGMLEGYDFITGDVMQYFERRLDQAPRDAGYALNYVITHARTRAEQEAVMNALRFKCAVLWTQLDALYAAYVAPGHIPPGAFDPATYVQRERAPMHAEARHE